MESWYTEWIKKTPALAGIGIALLIVGVTGSGLNSDVRLADEIRETLLSGMLAYSLFAAMLVLLVALGWQFDRLPGRSITLAVSAFLMASLVLLFAPMAGRNGWMPVWSGVMTGLTLGALYVAWRIQARLAVMTILAALYVMVVAGCFIVFLVEELTLATGLALLMTGALVVSQIWVLLSRVQERAQKARREPLRNHIRQAAVETARPVLIWSAGALLMSLPVVFLGENALRITGVVFAMGGLLSMFITLCFPAPMLTLLAPETEAPVETERPARRESRKRGSS
jgi:MFS family permease